MALLEIKNLTHRFGGLCAVSDLNETLEPGQTVGLIGPNGAGKTTVFNLVSGFYVPTQGVITFGNEVISGKKPHQITNRHIARTFQNIRLWKDMTVIENIMISQHGKLGYQFWEPLLRTKGYRVREQEIYDEAMSVLEAFSLVHVAQEQPKNLPYGIQRKVELARALSIKPKLLMLDEPAAGLNSVDVTDLISLIDWIRSEFDLTIWMIEHQMQVVMNLCTRIKVIDFGQTIADGTPEEIQSNDDVIKAYLGEGNIE